MLRKIVERAGDAGLSSLDRLSTRRGFLQKSAIAAAAVAGVGIASKDALAVAAYYCVSSSGCIVRNAPSGGYLLTYSYGNLSSYSGGGYSSSSYTGCVGVVNGDQEYYWRKRDGYTRYVHANLLSPYLYQAC